MQICDGDVTVLVHVQNRHEAVDDPSRWLSSSCLFESVGKFFCLNDCIHVRINHFDDLGTGKP